MRAGVQMPIIVAIKKTGKPASLSVLGCIEYLIVAMKLHWHPLVPSQVRIAHMRLGMTQADENQDWEIRCCGPRLYSLVTQNHLFVNWSNIHSPT